MTVIEMNMLSEINKKMNELNNQYKESGIKESRNEIIEKIDELLNNNSLTDQKKQEILNIIYNILTIHW